MFYQDNKGTILLEKNRKSPSSKRTKHIQISFFLIAKYISKEEFNVEWWPTNKMIGYLMTKTMQGSLFNKFRELIMGVIPIKKDIKESETKNKRKWIFGPWNQEA